MNVTGTLDDAFKALNQTRKITLFMVGKSKPIIRQSSAAAADLVLTLFPFLEPIGPLPLLWHSVTTRGIGDEAAVAQGRAARFCPKPDGRGEPPKQS